MPDMDVVNKLLQLLDSRGWDSVTVDEMAAEAGISRATFFRSFGSKEDVVFADHEVMLDRLQQFLHDNDSDIVSTMTEGILLVFRHHLGDSERTLARHRLLKQSSHLRNRELLTSYRYERVFREWLRSRLSGPHSDVEHAAVALSSSGVALHNNYLRRWLRDAHDSLEQELIQATKRLIRVILKGYDFLSSPGPLKDSTQNGVAVVVHFGEDPDTEDILEAVRKALTSEQK